VYGERAGYVGAPATPGVTDPTFGRVREREKTNLHYSVGGESEKKKTFG
jgi:hypothetical protein